MTSVFALLVVLLRGQDVMADPLPEGASVRLGTSRLFHSRALTAIAFSRNGKLLASGGCDGKVRLWEMPSGRPVLSLEIGATIYKPWVSLAFSPDGKSLAARCDDAVRIWSLPSGEPIRTVSAPGEKDAPLAFSPDGKELACLLPDLKLLRIQAQTGAEVTPSISVKVDGETEGVCLAYAPDGKSIAVGAGTVAKAFDLSSGEPRALFKGHTGPITSVDFSADGSLLLTASQDGSLRLWETTSGEELRSIPGYTSGAIRACFIPGTWRFISTRGAEASATALFRPGTIGTFREFDVFDVGTGKRIDTLRQEEPGFAPMAISPDGAFLASAGRQSIHLWDLATGKEISPRAGHRTSVDAIALSPDGRVVATAASGDPIIRLWDRTTGKETGQLKGTLPFGGTHQLAFFPDERTLAQASPPIQLWDLSTREELHWSSGNHRKDFLNGRAFALSPDGWSFASAGPGGTIQIRDVASGRRLETLKSDAPDFTSIVISTDGKTLAAGGADASIRLWETSTAKLRWKSTMASEPVGGRAPGEGATWVSFHPDGRSLVVFEGGRMRVLDLDTGRMLQQPNPDGAWPGGLSLRLSPDGKTVASWQEDGVTLWETASGTRIWKHPGHEGGATHGSHPLEGQGACLFAFSPDGRAFVSAPDGIALVWNLAAAIVPVGATPAEDLDRRWSELLERKGGAARSAIQALVAGGNRTVEAFDDRLTLIPRLSSERRDALLKELGSDDIEARERAAREICEQGNDADVRACLGPHLPSEVRARLEGIQADWSTPYARSTDGLRYSRAIQILELIGTREARALLDKLGRIARLDREREDARSALMRLSAPPPK